MMKMIVQNDDSQTPPPPTTKGWYRGHVRNPAPTTSTRKKKEAGKNSRS